MIHDCVVQSALRLAGAAVSFMFPTGVKARTVWRLGLAAAFCLLPLAPARAQSNSTALKLLISPEQPVVAEPEAARIVLQIHNATPQTLWLYRRAQPRQPPPDQMTDESQPPRTTGSSTVAVKLDPADAHAAAVSPATATVLAYVLMPKPRLVKLAAGGDYKEVSIVHLAPALDAGHKPIWGAYRLTVAYAASFSNGDRFQRDLNEPLWQGEVASNAVNIELRPPLPGSTGTVSGTTVNKDLQPLGGIRVSLQDEQGQLIDQQVTGDDGRFSFAHLPLALYWITGRRDDAVEDTVTFRHEQLSAAAPSASDQLVFYPQEIYEEKKLVHKPVLVRIFDAGHAPVAGIEIDAIYSNGDVIDDVKATTADDGTAPMELLPGRSSVSLHFRGCADQSERFDVSPGVGVDCFRVIFSCEKK